LEKVLLFLFFDIVGKITEERNFLGGGGIKSKLSSNNFG